MWRPVRSAKTRRETAAGSSSVDLVCPRARDYRRDKYIKCEQKPVIPSLNNDRTMVLHPAIMGGDGRLQIVKQNPPVERVNSTLVGWFQLKTQVLVALDDLKHPSG